MMELFLRLYLIFLLLRFSTQGLPESSEWTWSSQQFSEDLKTLCPYTSFCGINASLSFSGSKHEMPCCQGCSCEPSCGLNSNCCFKHLDKYNVEEKYKMKCQSTMASNTPIVYAKHFRMINSCIQTQKPGANQLDIDTHYHPVYSATTGFIYYNQEVASCNSANDSVPFQKAIQCSFQEDYMKDVNRIIAGFEPVTLCLVRYLEPEGVDLKSEECKHNIRKCNVTGTVMEWKPFWEYCEKFNATFVIHSRYREYSYANIYCYMCNEIYDKDSTRNLTCMRLMDKFTSDDFSLTVILKPEFLLSDESPKNRADTSGVCPQGQVFVHSFRKSCRPIQCPVWKILMRGKCEFYSTQWIGGGFSLSLLVETASQNSKIPPTFFDDMPQSKKNDKFARWLRRKTMKRWNFTTFYHLSADDSSVEYLFIETIYPFPSVNPSYVEDTVKMTLEDFWYIIYKKERIPLKVFMNDDKAYIVRIREQNYSNVSLKTGSGFSYKYSLEKEINSVEFNEELYKVSDGLWEPLLKKIPITSMFFCKQVDLLPEEYQDNEFSIFFKVKNITLYNFRRVNAMEENSEFLSKTSGTFPKTVRICLSEFGQATNAGHCCYMFSTDMFVFKTAAYVGISFMFRHVLK